jgi:AraC-like DNA-binding protein/ligand-binding sensor protein
MFEVQETIKRVAHTISKGFSIECNTLDMHEIDGYEKRLKNQYCSYCIKEQLRRFKMIKCENLHIFSAHQADRWGGKYEYLCPAGLAFVCTTIFNEAEIRNSIYAGPFLMVGYDEFINEDLDIMFQGMLPSKLISETKKLTFIESGRVSSLANILLALALQAKDRSYFELQIIEQTAKTSSELFHTLYGIKVSDNVLYQYPIEHEKLLQRYIAQGDKAASQNILNEVLGHIFFCSGGNFEIIKARITELIVLLSRAAIEGGASVAEIFGLNFDYLNDIHKFKNLDDLNFWLSNVLLRFTSAVFDTSMIKHSDIIKKIIQYIRENYMRKISLNNISDSVNFSVSYICKLFKDEMNINLTNYINHVRVENSKILLARKETTLSDVAFLCGFDDQSYFSKVFKKSTGTTPGLYREKHKNI